jgi:hypothetical protein
MGVKLFVSGEIAYAADINEFFMEQAIAKFVNVAARTSAFGNGIPLSVVGGDGKPLLKEGQFCYLEDNSLASDGSGIPEVQFYNGTIWVGAENFSVSDGEITNVKVNAAAAIALSKLAPGTAGQIIVANASGVPTYVTLGGDATINSSGQLTVSGSTAVTLGSETVGDYVASLVQGTGVTVTNNSGEGTTPTIAIGQSVATTASPTFANLTLSGNALVTGNVVYNIATASVANSASITSTSSGKFIEAGTSASVAGTYYVDNSGWSTGAQVTIMQMGTGSASIAFPVGTSLRGTPISGTTAVLRTQYSSVTLISRLENDWFVVGDLKV